MTDSTIGTCTATHVEACKAGGTSPPFTSLAPGLEAVYISRGVKDVTALPVVGVDERGRALVMTRRGRVVLATKARPRGTAEPHRACYFAEVREAAR